MKPAGFLETLVFGVVGREGGGNSLGLCDREPRRREHHQSAILIPGTTSRFLGCRNREQPDS